MKNLSHTLDKEMYWVQPDVWNTQYELHTKAGILIETFDYQRGFLKSAVNVRSVLGGWQLKQGGFFNSDIIVVDLKTNSEIATYPITWPGGWVEFTSNNKFLWKPLDFFHTEWGFENEQKNVLFSLRYGAKENSFADLFKTQAIIELKEHGYRYNKGELSLLFALGWWLLLLKSKSSATMAALLAAS